MDYQGEGGAARADLDTLEQLRWVLGGLLDSKDLPSLWPIRLILTKKNPGDRIGFVRQNGQYLILAAPGEKLPLGDVAHVFLEANTGTPARRSRRRAL